MEFPVDGAASYYGSAGLPLILILFVAASGGLSDPAFHHTEENDARGLEITQSSHLYGLRCLFQ
jgi:hypothetical protein